LYKDISRGADKVLLFINLATKRKQNGDFNSRGDRDRSCDSGLGVWFNGAYPQDQNAFLRPFDQEIAS
jgi:hypothetical protein